MSDRTGLRERKKQRTYDAVSSLAIGMFLEHGFDSVAVSDIAAAAEISKPTLFRYFRSKEDLALHRLADHAGEPARVVAARADGRSPLAALQRHFAEGLARRDPVTGLNDEPAVLAYHDMIFSTPALAARVGEFQLRDEVSLAEALAPVAADALTARLAAAQILAVQRVLARANWEQLSAGGSAADLFPAATAAAERAFEQLRTGLTV